MKPTIYQLLILGLIFKIFLGLIIPLSPDEAYYWVWSHHLQLSYFDHPPFISWLFLIGQFFESLGSGVRIPGIILGQLTLYIWILILRTYFSEKQLWLWTLLAHFMPFLGPAGLIITPDTPMMFFWGLTLLLTLQLVQNQKAIFALLSGFALGLGFCSKYPIVLIVPILFFIFFEHKISRKKMISWSFLGFFGSLITSSPVWIWNLSNELQSFQFQMSHGFGGGGIQPKYFIDYTLAQIGLVFPTVLYFAFKGSPQAPKWLVLAGTFPIAFFGFSSFFSYAEVNWPIAAHPALLALSLFGLSSTKWIKTTISIWAVVFALVISEAIFIWLPNVGVRLKTNVLSKYNQVISSTENLTPLYARTYQMAATLSFAQKRQIYKLRGMNRKDFYDSLEFSTPKTEEFYLILKNGEELPTHLKTQYLILKREPIDSQFEIALMKGLF